MDFAKTIKVGKISVDFRTNKPGTALVTIMPDCADVRIVAAGHETGAVLLAHALKEAEKADLMGWLIRFTSALQKDGYCSFETTSGSGTMDDIWGKPKEGIQFVGVSMAKGDAYKMDFADLALNIYDHIMLLAGAYDRTMTGSDPCRHCSFHNCKHCNKTINPLTR